MSASRGASRAVLLAMILYADPDTGLLWPGHETLVSASGQSYRAVQRAVVELPSHGEIVVLDDGRGRGKAGKYQLLVPDTAGRRPAVTAAADRPLVNPVKPATRARKGAENAPDRRAARVTKGEGDKEGPQAPASGGGLVPPRRGLRVNGENPRAVAAARRSAERKATAQAAAAAMMAPTAEHEQAWRSMRGFLRDATSEGTFGIWLEPLMLCGVDREGSLIVCGPHQIIDWTRERFGPLLAAAAAAAGVVARFCTPIEANGLLDQAV